MHFISSKSSEHANVRMMRPIYFKDNSCDDHIIVRTVYKGTCLGFLYIYINQVVSYLLLIVRVYQGRGRIIIHLNITTYI